MRAHCLPASLVFALAVAGLLGACTGGAASGPVSRRAQTHSVASAPVVPSTPSRVAATIDVSEAGLADHGDANQQPETVVAARKILLRSEHDVDGQPGPEQIVLYDDGSLLVGSALGRVDLTDAGDFWMHEQAALDVVTLEPGVQAVLVTLPLRDEEDPSSRFQLFVQQRQRWERVLDISPGFARSSGLRFPGDGSARYLEDLGRACGRMGPARRTAVIHEVIYQRRGTTMSAPKRKPTSQTVECSVDNLIACPRVYTGANESTLAGEILRNLNRPEHARLQGLTLSQASAGVLHVVLAEEKEEVTQLDEIFVQLGAVRIAPRACTQAQTPAYCSEDRQAWTLEQGDRLVLEFDLPAANPSPILFARGYYQPTRLWFHPK